MYPAPIDEYVRPATVADARAALGRYDEGDAVFVGARHMQKPIAFTVAAFTVSLSLGKV